MEADKEAALKKIKDAQSEVRTCSTTAGCGPLCHPDVWSPSPSSSPHTQELSRMRAKAEEDRKNAQYIKDKEMQRRHEEHMRLVYMEEADAQRLKKEADDAEWAAKIARGEATLTQKQCVVPPHVPLADRLL